MARDYRTRPSELLAIPDTWAAYQLDEAVHLFAGEVQRRVDRAEAGAMKGKRDPARAVQAALEEALGIVPQAVAARPSARGVRYEYDLSDPGRVIARPVAS